MAAHMVGAVFILPGEKRALVSASKTSALRLSRTLRAFSRAIVIAPAMVAGSAELPTTADTRSEAFAAACGVAFIFIVGAAVVDGLVGLFL